MPTLKADSNIKSSFGLPIILLLHWTGNGIEKFNHRRATGANESLRFRSAFR